MNPEFLIILITSCLAVNLSPGPSILLVTSISAAKGLKAALFTILGMSAAAFIHVILAASGIAAILAASAITFTLIQYLGAGYLIYLGIDLIRSRAVTATSYNEMTQTNAWQYFRRGFLVDLFNPKIALFFLAFLPQFLSWLETPGFLLSLSLGSVFLLTGILVNSSIAYLVSKGVKRNHGRFGRWVKRWIPGSVLVLLGVRLLWEEV
jgi:threonine/homoserine/homoserine lactone efflux protein